MKEGLSLNEGIIGLQKEKANELSTSQEFKELLQDPNAQKFWGRFQRLVLTAGLSFAMAACGLSRQEIEKMPETKVEDLAKNGLNAYKDRGLIKTRGIPEFVKADDAEHLELDSIELGDTEVPYLKKVIKRTDFFKLHAGPEKNSPAIDMAADGGKSEYVFMKKVPQGSGLKGTRLYLILGKVAEITDSKGKKGTYFEIDSMEDKTMEEYPDINKKK